MRLFRDFFTDEDALGEFADLPSLALMYKDLVEKANTNRKFEDQIDIIVALVESSNIPRAQELAMTIGSRISAPFKWVETEANIATKKWPWADCKAYAEAIVLSAKGELKSVLNKLKSIVSPVQGEAILVAMKQLSSKTVPEKEDIDELVQTLKLDNEGSEISLKNKLEACLVFIRFLSLKGEIELAQYLTGVIPHPGYQERALSSIRSQFVSS